MVAIQDEYASLKLAVKEGKVIEMRTEAAGTVEWLVNPDPQWLLPPDWYRIQDERIHSIQQG